MGVTDVPLNVPENVGCVDTPVATVIAAFVGRVPTVVILDMVVVGAVVVVIETEPVGDVTNLTAVPVNVGFVTDPDTAASRYLVVLDILPPLTAVTKVFVLVPVKVEVTEPVGVPVTLMVAAFPVKVEPTEPLGVPVTVTVPGLPVKVAPERNAPALNFMYFLVLVKLPADKAVPTVTAALVGRLPAEKCI